MTKKIFRSMMRVVCVVLLASFAVVMGCLYDYFGDIGEGQLKDELALACEGVELSGGAYLERLSAESFRVTWVSEDGVVLYDSRGDAAAMENHSDRQEIRQALQSGSGESARYSATLLEKTLYCAKRLSDGTVLRLSVARATAGVLALGMLRPVLLVLIVALILSFVLAERISKRVVGPLNRLDMECPLENDTYEELAPLLTRLERQRQSIAEQMKQLKQQRGEFAQITASMREGLVLLDGKGAVVSINPTACRLFNTDNTCVGGDFLSVERAVDVSRAIEQAATDGHSQARLERAGRVYRLDVSRVESGGAAAGAVLLAFDVTEREQAEQNRREFTANVSHELKTPLQSIIGSAELLENGLVKPEDVPRFVGHIGQEAARLVKLIEDIIRLSQLDEGGVLPTEEVALLPLAREAADSLSDAARAKNVHISVDGSEAAINGVRRLLYEIVYNLCDNAVKYNVEGGSVDVTVSSDAHAAQIVVKDTGIGIAPEHQDRVFERFYRVDKSHSKASGGTGLGLSIVKHAVAAHRGTLTLQSAPGEGTQITVTLPAQ